MGTARALLLCNASYEDPEGDYRPLLGPPSNLVEMQRALTDPEFGVFDPEHVESASDLTSAKISDHLLDFLRRAEPGDTVLVYYAGHGERLAGGRLGLCGVDVTRETVKSRSFDTRNLGEWLEDECRASARMVVLDCCYSGQYMGAPPSTAEIVESFGEGVAVLTSGGNVPVRDSGAKDVATPFTRALVHALTAPSTRHTAGVVTPDDLYVALCEYRPPLQPKPQRRISGVGRLTVARRTVVPEPVPATELKGWTDREFETVDVRFDGVTVTSTWEGQEFSRPLETLDAPRLLAIRRLLQLLDVVVASANLRKEHYYPVRRAWQCIGTNLLEHAIPEELKARLVASDDEAATLRLRLHFAEGTDLARYPWEYLSGDFAVSEDRRDPPLPLALSNGVLIERVAVPAPRAAAPRRTFAEGAPPATRRPTSGLASTAPPPTDQPSRTTSGAQHPTGETHRVRTTTVGLVNAVPPRYYALGERLARELEHLSSTDVVFELGEQARERAEWTTFSDSMDQQPSFLVLLLPTRRVGSKDLRLGFGTNPEKPDWRPLADLERLLRPRRELQLVVLATLAAAPSTDAFRGNLEAAEQLSTRLGRPVIFLCHTAGFEEITEHLSSEDLRPATFTGLLLHALSMGKDPEQAFVYARDRVVQLMPEALRPLFGVPGYYLPGTPTTQDRP